MRIFYEAWSSLDKSSASADELGDVKSSALADELPIQELAATAAELQIERIVINATFFDKCGLN